MSYELMAIFSGVGVFNSLFFALFLWIYARGNKIANRFLALLLIAISMRMVKSLVYYILWVDSHNLIITLGHSGMMCIGPLIYLYFLSILKKGYRFDTLQLLHFISFFGVLILTPWLLKIKSSYLIRHVLMMSQFLAYIVLSGRVLYQSYRKGASKRNEQQSKFYIWLFTLLIAVSSVWLVYLLHNVLGLFDYIVAPALYSFLVYLVSFVFFTQRFGFVLVDEYWKRPVVQAHESRDIFRQVEHELRRNEYYLKDDLTLGRLAHLLNLKPYVLSHVVNAEAKQNFSDYINSYRVDKAKQALTENTQDTIAAIAFGCGFKSLSVFNAAFKSRTGYSPSGYRDSLLS